MGLSLGGLVWVRRACRGVRVAPTRVRKMAQRPGVRSESAKQVVHAGNPASTTCRRLVFSKDDGQGRGAADALGRETAPVVERH